MSSFRNKTFRGEFWCPAEPKLKGNGTLSIDDLGQAKLAISGAAAIAKAFGRGAVDYTVHGVISADYPYPVSLFSALLIKQSCHFWRRALDFPVKLPAERH